MKKSGFVWVLGMCAAMLLGLLGRQDLRGQTYKWKGRRGITPPVTVPAAAMNSVQDWVGEANKNLINIIQGLPGMTDEQVGQKIEECKQLFSNTYLKVPVLESEEFGVYIGWEEVIWTLKGIASHFQKVGDIEIVAVQLTPPYSEKMQADFRAEIATEMRFNPSTYILRGCGIHRTNCTSDDC
jgi:hypothetical protein